MLLRLRRLNDWRVAAQLEICGYLPAHREAGRPAELLHIEDDSGCVKRQAWRPSTAVQSTDPDTLWAPVGQQLESGKTLSRT